MGRLDRVLIKTDDDLEFFILRIIEEESEPIGAGFICESLIAKDMIYGEAKVGRLLRKLDYKRLTKRVGYQGRILTEYGKEYLKDLRLKRCQHLYGNELVDTFTRNSPKDLLEILIVRRVLEMEAARLAAMYRTNEEIKNLEIALEDSKIKNDIGIQTGEYDSQFHSMISNMSRNKILISAINLISLNKKLHNSFVSIRKRVGTAMIIDHINIVKAIRKQDPNEAAASMGKHIDTIIEDVRHFVDVGHPEDKTINFPS